MTKSSQAAVILTRELPDDYAEAEPRNAKL
jgi:hypothetical protein